MNACLTLLLLLNLPTPSWGFSVGNKRKTSLVLSSSPSADILSDPQSYYVKCGQCAALFEITDEDIDSQRRGRRLECSVCTHTWYQSRDRMMQVRDGFELIPLDENDLDRIKTNIAEGRSPGFMGEAKLYVGNLPFGLHEDDLKEIFMEVGTVGDVHIVTDDTGRSRGFGFITMYTRKDGDQALETLNGKEINGRRLNVRAATR
eukprot:CAMPEP_0118701122 /NCGR_PEP_ID=MMETSP0800-20121206/17052_1 /TAXON_ID=210618 ORGANISM="Striatella unipunctata, Strain CCMP2910" /NCGR_SAMPLE_ID=MMETSP0800 /ASSEMBLY_ACC=CAM_ASM_000638 /LENGTH=203 /DNA_ID=CAMNT_0006601961 /DNA_START=23 /DNA_END=634 /DNA_ORIENTATION=-